MQDDPQEVIRAELHDGERLLWSGRPRLGVLLRPIDAGLIPFSLLWGGFAIFWEVSVIRMGAPAFAIFGVPFVLIGLYIIVGRFFVDAWQRGKTYYGVTSERVIIRSGLLNQQTQSLNLRSLLDISLSERSSGVGTIAFGPSSIMSSWANPGAGWPGWGPSPPRFELADDSRQVYNIICDAQREKS